MLSLRIREHFPAKCYNASFTHHASFAFIFVGFTQQLSTIAHNKAYDAHTTIKPASTVISLRCKRNTNYISVVKKSYQLTNPQPILLSTQNHEIRTDF